MRYGVLYISGASGQVKVSESPREHTEHPVEELHSALASGRPDARCLAALKLARSGTLESLSRLHAHAPDANAAVEYTMRTGLELLRARLRNEVTIDPDQLHPHLDSPYIEERLETVVQLELVRRPESLAPLVAALQAETDPPVRASLVRAILSYRDASRREIGLLALSHAELEVRRAAIEGFWGWCDPAVDRAVLPLGEDADPRITAAVDVFIIRRGGKDAPHRVSALLACNETAPRVVALFAIGGVHEPWARKLAAEVIKDEALPQGVRTLARHVAVLQTLQLRSPAETRNTPEDQTIRTDLTHHLPPIPDAATLRAAMQSKEPLLRLHALQNAARFPAPESFPILERLIRWETDALVVATLVKAVTRVGGHEQAPAITKFLAHPDARVRANTLEALAGADAFVDVIFHCKARLAEDDSPRVRTLAASYLFRKSPDQAVAYFRGIVLGTDSVARESALLILTTVREDGVLRVFREALRDPRRDVYQRAYQVLDALATSWDQAATLRREFHAGHVAGEVVEDEPVSALLEAVNSAALTDRIHAIQKLARAADTRVDVVLELNLVARNATIRREAWAALNTRHTHVTLPALFQRLGHSFLELTSAGHALVPWGLKQRLGTVHSAGAPVPSGDRDVQAIGRLLYEWFERDQPMDGGLRRTCLEIQTAMAHVGGASGSASGLPTEPTANTRVHGRAAELIAQISGDVPPGVMTDDTPEEHPSGALARIVALCVVLGGVATIAAVTVQGLGGSDPAGAAEAGRAELSGEAAQLQLNRMASERDPVRFVDRFGGQALEFRGSFDRVGDDLVTTYVWAGSVLFSIHPGLSTHRIPRNLQRRQACTVIGHVRDRMPDGVIAIIGSIKPIAP